MKKNNNGFTFVEILVVVIIVGLLGTVGWLVYNRQITTQDTTSQQKTTAYVPVVPVGWNTKNDATSGVSYAVDNSWPDQTKITVYKTDQDIPMGYGAPVSVRFNATTKVWEEYESDTKRANTNTKDASAKVLGNLPTATVSTGDGGTSELRILFARNDQVFQLSLPPVVSEDANPYAAHVDTIIKSIDIK